MAEVLISVGLILVALAWVLLTRHLARAQRFDYFEERKWAPIDKDWRFPSSYMKRKP